MAKEDLVLASVVNDIALMTQLLEKMTTLHKDSSWLTVMFGLALLASGQSKHEDPVDLYEAATELAMQFYVRENR